RLPAAGRSRAAGRALHRAFLLNRQLLCELLGEFEYVARRITVRARRCRVAIGPALVTHAWKQNDFRRNADTTPPGVAGSILWGTKAEYLCHVLPPLTWRPSDSRASSSIFDA